MAQIEAHDEANYLMLTRAYIPTQDSALSAWPSSPAFLRKNKSHFDSREEAVAYVATALGRQSAYHQRGFFRDGFDGAMSVPLETWVIGPSLNDESTFAQFFEDESKCTDLRLLIHRNPVVEGACPDYWKGVYKNKRMGLVGKGGHFKHLKLSIAPFLDEMLQAYQQSDDVVQELMQETAHPYCNARWTP